MSLVKILKSMQFFYKDTINITDEKFKNVEQSLIEYREKLSGIVETGGYLGWESPLNLPSDNTFIDEAKALSSNLITEKLKYIFVVGIGGSSLGTKAIYDALYGYTDLFSPTRFPKMLFIDTNEQKLVKSVRDCINSHINTPEEALVISISKSGGTTETIANTEWVVGSLIEKYSREDALKRLVVITNKDSPFWNHASSKNIERLQIPEFVGGRFSVLSHVGLFPLTALGVNVRALLDGAREMRDICLNKKFEENPAMVSAAAHYIHLKQGKIISDTFTFHPQLESLGKWYRQIMGESLGKEKNKNDEIVHAGITPTVSVGSTDLHSVGQLYLGGPRDKLTTFLWSKNSDSSVKIQPERIFPELVPMIGDNSANEIMNAILGGVKKAYMKEGLPFLEIYLDDISEHSLGEFIQFKMMEIMYLGHLLNINTFDQPNVESYKTETRMILA
jgi:glucose-6-phosphate isomerase